MRPVHSFPIFHTLFFRGTQRMYGPDLSRPRPHRPRPQSLDTFCNPCQHCTSLTGRDESGPYSFLKPPHDTRFQDGETVYGPDFITPSSPSTTFPSIDSVRQCLPTMCYWREGVMNKSPYDFVIRGLWYPSAQGYHWLCMERGYCCR